jgi:hypothetical protein
VTGKPWQKKRRNGRRGGVFYGAVKGGLPTNLQTTDPKLALERLRLLRAGKWAPVKRSRGDEIAEQEAAAAAAAVDAVQGGEPPPAAAAAEPTPEASPAPPAPPPPDPLPSPVADTIKPDAVIPPPATTWNADAAAAASDAGGDGEAGSGDAGAGEKAQYVNPDQILDLLAQGVVEGGKIVGRWVARRQRKIPNTLDDPKARELLSMIENMTAACAKQTLVDLAPLLADDIHPGWGMVAGFGLIAAVQFVGAAPDPNAPPSDDDGEK